MSGERLQDYWSSGFFLLPSCSISIDVHLRTDNLSNLLFVLYHVLVEREYHRHTQACYFEQSCSSAFYSFNAYFSVVLAFTFTWPQHLILRREADILPRTTGAQCPFYTCRYIYFLK